MNPSQPRISQIIRIETKIGLDDYPKVNQSLSIQVPQSPSLLVYSANQTLTRNQQSGRQIVSVGFRFRCREH